MAPKRKAQLTIAVKPKKLTARERARLRKAVRTVISIMDQHDLNKIKMDVGVCLIGKYQRD
jgi:hypothetical protein